MDNLERFKFQQLDAYKVAREIAVRVHEAKISDAELRDQATRAAKSAFLGLCEGLPNEQPGLRRRYAVAKLHLRAGGRGRSLGGDRSH